MAKKKGTKSSGRFGSRYGKTPRKSVDEIEEKSKNKYECPKCKILSLKRTEAGIWKCSKCGTKVSGGAYIPKTGANKLLKKALRKAEKGLEEENIS